MKDIMYSLQGNGLLKVRWQPTVRVQPAYWLSWLVLIVCTNFRGYFSFSKTKSWRFQNPETHGLDFIINGGLLARIDCRFVGMGSRPLLVDLLLLILLVLLLLSYKTTGSAFCVKQSSLARLVGSGRFFLKHRVLLFGLGCQWSLEFPYLDCGREKEEDCIFTVASVGATIVVAFSCNLVSIFKPLVVSLCQLLQRAFVEQSD